MKKQRKKRNILFFSPDDIVTTISRDLTLDLQEGKHEYALSDYSNYFCARQSSEFTKKYVSEEEDTPRLEALTFEKFKKVNEHMERFRDIITPDPTMRIQPDTCERDRILLRARALMYQVLGEFSVTEWFEECKHSTGSSIGVPYHDTSLEAKFQWPLTGTYGVKSLMEMYLAYDTNCRLAVENHNSDIPVIGWYKTVEGSKASTVEKNDSIRRMICVEPTANMFLQQGIMEMLYKRMKVVGLDVESLPDVHQELARLSSLTQQFATIDWSSASDCMSIGLLRWLIPPKWFDIIDRIRTTTTHINGEPVSLNMFSTMGNAVTFPLETLIFWTLAVAVLQSSKPGLSLFPEWEDQRTCSVFGDDCIVPSHIASKYIDVMEELGFMINREKSHVGPEKFRESCGGDYLAGRSVRPYYIKAPTSRKKSALEPWLYIIGNSLLTKYRLYFGDLTYVYDKRVWRTLFALFAKYRLDIKLVPSDFPDDAGLKIGNDLDRFARHYRIQLSPIYRDVHGTCEFRYCNFQYTEKREKSGDIRLAVWLKKPVTDPNPKQMPWINPRRKGGYVEGIGRSAFWSDLQLQFKL